MATKTVTPGAATAMDAEQQATIWQTTMQLIRPAIVLTLALTVLLGLVYPGIVTGLAQLFFPSQANGSLVYRNGQPVASQYIGQYWTQPQYFHGRPSATLNLSGTPAPYQANNSAGSNLGPTNSALSSEVQANIDAVRKENPAMPVTTPIPVDLVTSSASGLDPDLSIASAYYQIPRIAKARGMTTDAVQKIVDDHIEGRFLGIFGEPRVNVLDLNLALDQVKRH